MKNITDTTVSRYLVTYCEAYGFWPEDDEVAEYEALDREGRADRLRWLKDLLNETPPDCPEYFAQLAEEQAERDAELDFFQEGV